MRFAPLVLALISVVAPAACSRESAPAKPAAETAPPASADTAVVTGKVPPGSIVSLVPADARTLPAAGRPASMDQFERQFYPEVLVAHTGQPVQFSNSENELHNVRVLYEDEKTKARTTVYYTNLDPSTLKTHSFEKPGFYDVRCDFHDSMQASIFVAPTPYAARAGDDGGFSFASVEPGAYTLKVVTEGREQARAVTVVAPRTEVAN